MPEIFLGDIANVKLFDILKPLFGGKKTGKIIFKGKEEGELYLELGNITHAKTNNAVGEYAFFTLMGLKVGKASFEPDEVPLERTISISTEQLLLNWSYRKQEWDKIKEAISSSNTIFHLSLQKSQENKNITAEQWNVLALCNGTKNVSEIAETLSWDEFRTSKIILQLIQLGLLVRAEGQRPAEKKFLGENFFQKVENEFKKAVGPMASIIIDDKIEEFGNTRSSFPQDQTLSFIEALAEEIPRDGQKKEFIRVMMEVLSSGK
jgi:predicted transcriptional regulator